VCTYNQPMCKYLEWERNKFTFVFRFWYLDRDTSWLNVTQEIRDIRRADIERVQSENTNMSIALEKLSRIYGPREQ